MEDTNINLKPKKKNLLEKINELFKDKHKRYLFMLLFMSPFIIAIIVFGIISFKEAKNVINLISGDTTVNDKYLISSMNYQLRDNATDIQQEYFEELKDAVEDGSDDASIAGLVCKNFVADFFTWSNKAGQYDVGGFNYVYKGKNETMDVETNIYTSARDGFYKYLNNYISQYGASNLLEVESVNIDKAQKASYQYEIHERTDKVLAEDGETVVDIYENVKFDAFDVKCSWTYKVNSKFDTSKYATSSNFLVINHNGRFEIVEMSQSEIDAHEFIYEEVQNEENNQDEIEDENESEDEFEEE